MIEPKFGWNQGMGGPATDSRTDAVAGKRRHNCSFEGGYFFRDSASVIVLLAGKNVVALRRKQYPH